MRYNWKKWCTRHQQILREIFHITLVLGISLLIVVSLYVMGDAQAEGSQQYTTPDGHKWDYCVELSDKREDGIMFYMVCTNNKDLTYEEWVDARIKKESGSEDYEDFYLVKENFREYEDFWY